MEKIKFRSQDSNEKEFAKEVRKRVRQYFKDNNISTHGNYKMYIKMVVMMAMYVAPFLLVLFMDMSAWMALVMALIMGVGEAGIGMSVMHDGAHGSFSSKAWVNELFSSTMYLLGSNTFNWKIQHNVGHHTFTNVYEYDDDIATKAVVRLSEHSPLKKFYRYQHIYAFPLYGLMTFLKFFGEIPTLLRYKRQGFLKEFKANASWEVAKLIITKVIYLFVMIGLPLLLTPFSFWQTLIGFVSLHLVAGIIMTTVFQMAHIVEGTAQPLPDESHTLNKDWMVHELETTSDFGRKNGILSWYIGGLDFQIEHHLFQNICHIHYPAIAPIVQATAEKYGFKYNLKPTIFHALASHFRRLKELGRLEPVPVRVNSNQ
jgi:linoleoyl-CoA desaturase